MCHPGIFQELVHTGYKKYHRIKFQVLVVLNGLLIHLNGPYHTPQNDLGVLAESSLLTSLEQCESSWDQMRGTHLSVGSSRSMVIQCGGG